MFICYLNIFSTLEILIIKQVYAYTYYFNQVLDNYNIYLYIYITEKILLNKCYRFLFLILEKKFTAHKVNTTWTFSTQLQTYVRDSW